MSCCFPSFAFILAQWSRCVCVCVTVDFTLNDKCAPRQTHPTVNIALMTNGTMAAREKKKSYL